VADNEIDRIALKDQAEFSLKGVKDEPQFRTGELYSTTDVLLKALTEPPAAEAKAKREEEARAAEHKRQQEVKDADYKRKERFALVCFALVALSIFFGLCFFVYLKGSVEDKKWSLATLAGIVTWIITYTFGRPRTD
jgi:hypothetical protein